MRYIYLSPHLDDVVFSCGGNIWRQSREGSVVGVWTVCAGEPGGAGFSAFAESLHRRWGLDGHAAVRARRDEDRRACRALGARPRHLHIADCIYRRRKAGGFLYDSEEAIFGTLAEEEDALVEDVAGFVAGWLEDGDELYCPLAVGGHVDHQLVRRAAERLGRPLVYFADLPYALRPGTDAGRLAPPTADVEKCAVSAEALGLWVSACQIYASQFGSFWEDGAALRADLERSLGGGGLRLWRSPSGPV
jgi:LmbE family N-acetylglucosaminyl deacetylase